MKIACIALNALLVSLFFLMIFEKGLPQTNEDDFWVFVWGVITPLVTLYYLLFGSSSESWLQLYFRRKVAEEKQKLKHLQDAGKS